MDQPRNGGPPNHLPSTFIVGPSSHHTHSILLLHGLGSNGHKFGSELIQCAICSNGKTLPELLPGARFIFPTSKRRRSSAFSRAKLTQWFDIASLDDPSYRSHTQTQGLEESYVEILGIIKQEVEKVPRKNIVLGGLSQGCAMGLDDIDHLLNVSGDDTAEDDPFGSDSAEEEALDLEVKVLNYIRVLLSIDNPKPLSRKDSALATPVFLGHGDADEKVHPSLGEQAYQTMKDIGFQADWKRYEGQGHWYKIPEEIDDIVGFIQTKVGWPI